MNFIREFQRGQTGSNKGLPMGEGLEHIEQLINGVQGAMIYSVGAGSKVGKTTMVDSGFVIEPVLYALENGIEIEIIYFSYEIDRISKEFDYSCHFLYRDHGIDRVVLPEGKKVLGKNYVEISSNYLRGRVRYDSTKDAQGKKIMGDIVLVPENVIIALQTVYRDRIELLFGKYNYDTGELISPGIIKFYEERENPTGLRNHIMSYAKKNGRFTYSNYQTIEKGKTVTKTRMTGYLPNNSNKYTFIVTDHLRKLKGERGFQTKQIVDKFVEYSVEFRNWCKFTFIHIIHLNRSIADVKRLQFAGDNIYPTGDDFKDTGNLSEESDFVFTMMNPNDGKYNLDQHFGLILRAGDGSLLHPQLRTIHLVESRHCSFPEHFRVNMRGNIKTFERLKVTEPVNYENQV